MKKVFIFCICLLFTGLFLGAAGCTQAPTGMAAPAPVPEVTTVPSAYTANETLVAFVDEAAAYVKTHGPDQALEEFNKKNGSFVRGEFYIYAYGFNGTTLAHPVNPESVGKKREGANGVFVTEMGKVVQNGSGFYPFVYINPQHNRTFETKLGYGARVDDDWWLGSGVYLGPVEPAVASSPDAPSTSQELKDFVDHAADYAGRNGRAAALSAFFNRTGPFVKGDVYIYALDYSGNVLALLHQPLLVGTSFYDMQDESGRYYTRTEIQLAKDGGGYLLYKYPNPSKNYSVMYKISYVRPVDSTYWIGAGLYTREDLLVDQEVRQLVADAKAYVRANGREKALLEFNNPNGSFTRDGLYVFADDYNGTVLAWPYRPDMIGVNMLNATDEMGMPHFQAILNSAKNGTGMVNYYTVNPMTNTTQLKISYVTDIDGTWVLGAGRYMEPGPQVLRG